VKQKLRVGVVLEWNPCPYSRLLRHHLEVEAPRHEATVDLVSVSWAYASAKEALVAAEQTIEAVDAYDALVLVSGVFAHGVGGLQRLARAWEPRPAVSIAYLLPGVPTILVDNRNGAQLATRHLIEEHGRRRLLFLRGRRDSREADDRYFGFRHALRDHGILLEASLVLQGDFLRATAADAVARLPSDVVFDGVVSSNDDMALAILPALHRRGLVVPDDVAIVGFDDIPEAAAAEPPLTSMAQPYAAFAREALGSLVAQARGRPVPPTLQVPVTLVQRRSCGCRMPRPSSRAAAR